MADLTSAAAPEVQERAKAMGWIGPENFKGDPERFVDADAFIERGETVLPIVKKQLENTRVEFEAFKKQAGLTSAALTQLQEKQKEADVRIAAEKQRAVDDAIKATKAALAKANEAGDHEAAAELTGDLVELDGDKKAAAKDVEDAKAKPATDKPVVADDKAAADLRVVNEWIADGNDWFKTNRRKQSLMQGISMEIRENPDHPAHNLLGKAFMNACKAEMLKILGEDAPASDKVESGRNGSGEETQVRGGGKKSFNNLPADAKAQCDADGKRFVGPGKRYETQAAWRARFAEIYFERD